MWMRRLTCALRTSRSLRNSDAARSILDDIAAVYERLEHLPEATPLCRDTYLRAKEYRKIALPHHNYLLIYRVAAQTVYIVGVFHMLENDREKL
mgnify:CR=1 FL=1